MYVCACACAGLVSCPDHTQQRRPRVRVYGAVYVYQYVVTYHARYGSTCTLWPLLWSKPEPNHVRVNTSSPSKLLYVRASGVPSLSKQIVTRKFTFIVCYSISLCSRTCCSLHRRGYWWRHAERKAEAQALLLCTMSRPTTSLFFVSLALWSNRSLKSGKRRVLKN